MTIRQRNSAALDSDGIKIVRDRYKQSFTQPGWAIKSSVSESTLKRLLAGRRIDLDLLKAALRPLGLEVEDFTLIRSDIPIPIEPDTQPSSSQPRNPDFYMRVTFTDTNKCQIGYALEDLQTLLEGHTLKITPSGNCVTISSDFPDSLRDKVETILKHIQALAEDCVVKGDVVLTV